MSQICCIPITLGTKKTKQGQWVPRFAFHSLFAHNTPQKGPWHQICLGDLPKGSVLSTQLHMTGGALLTSETGSLQIPFFPAVVLALILVGQVTAPAKKEMGSFQYLDASPLS